jgi:hypothetical protein
MTPSRFRPWMFPARVALVASAIGLSGCERAAPVEPDADAPAVVSDASARPPRPAYLDEFNETIRSMEAERNDGHVKHGWGIFSTIKAPARARAPVPPA